MESPERVEDRISQLTHRGLDLITFWKEATEILTPAIPHFMTPCWFTLDPASLLVTSHFQEGLPEIPGEWLAAEYYQDDFNKMADVAKSEAGVATLFEATGGEPSRSARYREQMVPYGGEQELLAGLRGRAGEIWGVVGLYREKGQEQFGPDELGLMQRLSPHLAEGARRALLLGEATNPEGPDSPGLLVLDQNMDVESATPGVAEWLDDLPDGDRAKGMLPSSISAVAGQARRSATGVNNGEVAFARVLSRSGRWVVLHGASLISYDQHRVAVIIEVAHPARIIPLLMSVYHLSEREQDVTRLVLQGHSTTEIAESLFISANTVQQHLKSIFEKTGVRSRRDLIGKVFFTHYEPRVRDNEHRMAKDEPVRGGPIQPDLMS